MVKISTLVPFMFTDLTSTFINQESDQLLVVFLYNNNGDTSRAAGYSE